MTYNERAYLAQTAKTMFGITNESNDDDNENVPWSHKDLGSCRIKQDEEDLQKIEQEFQRFNVFSTKSLTVVSITTGDVATDDISQALQNVQILGKETQMKFVEEKLVKKKTGFHDP